MHNNPPSERIDADIGVVVVSSDGYADFWPIFFSCWDRYSPFSALPLYLITATRSFQSAGKPVTVINTPNSVDLSWGDRIGRGLQQIPHRHVLVTTEDLLFVGPSPADCARQVVRFIAERQPTYLRLTPHPPAQGRVVEPNIRELPSWAMHRASLQMSIWEMQKLRQLMQPGETPWQFEVNATRRSRSDPAYYCLEKGVNILEVVGRGKVTRAGACAIRSMGLSDHLQRPVFGRMEELKRNLLHAKAGLFYRLPANAQKYLLQHGYVGKVFL